MRYSFYLQGYNKPVIITDDTEDDKKKASELIGKAMSNSLTITINSGTETFICNGRSINGVLITAENNSDLCIVSNDTSIDKSKDNVKTNKYEHEKEDTTLLVKEVETPSLLATDKLSEQSITEENNKDK